jgi:hypothetical protein
VGDGSTRQIHTQSTDVWLSKVPIQTIPQRPFSRALQEAPSWRTDRRVDALVEYRGFIIWELVLCMGDASSAGDRTDTVLGAIRLCFWTSGAQPSRHVWYSRTPQSYEHTQPLGLNVVLHCLVPYLPPPKLRFFYGQIFSTISSVSFFLGPITAPYVESHLSSRFMIYPSSRSRRVSNPQ